jgi:hypothetical protein
VTDPIKVLLFEDTQSDAHLLAQALAKGASAGQQFEVTWFDGPFGRDIAGARPNAAWPIRGESVLMKISRDKIKEEQLPDQRRWQCEFDAAVLDIFDKQARRDVGYDFARWLANAEHRGTIVIQSVNLLAVSIRAGVRPQFVKKDAGDAGKWATDAAQHLIGAERAVPNVNHRGHEPTSLLSHFFSASGGKARNFSCAWFGQDIALATKALEFFQLRSFDAALGQRTKTHSLSEAAAVMQTATTQRSKPNLVFVDCDPFDGKVDDKTLEVLNAAIGATGDHGPGFPIIAVFFATKLDVSNVKLWRAINAAIVDRDQFVASPSLWAAQAIDELTARYKRFRALAYPRLPAKARGQSAKRNSEPVEKVPRPITWTPGVAEAGQELLQALCGPLAMARSMDKLVGTPLSLAEWIYPDRPLNTSLKDDVKKLVHQLKTDNDLSEDRAILFGSGLRDK